MDKLTESIIVDIIQRKLGLPAASVWLKDQNKEIPPDANLYVVVGFRDSTPYSASLPYLIEKTVGEVVNTYEVNEGQMGERITIDILSRSDAAIRRKNEIIMALNSIYSKQLQEKYKFKMARVPNAFLNTSHAEGGSRLNRYTITITCLTWFRKEELLASNGGMYYDTFETRVDDEKTIGTPEGIIEFQIPA
jgi:hypothetical protein